MIICMDKSDYFDHDSIDLKSRSSIPLLCHAVTSQSAALEFPLFGPLLFSKVTRAENLFFVFIPRFETT